METSKKAPAFQFYPQDFISSLDVQLMSAAEVGAYCLLLFNSWTQARPGYLLNNDRQLLAITRLTPEEWKRSKKLLLSKFPTTQDGKFRYNPRLAAEADKQADFRTKQAENGKRGGRPKKPEKPDPKPDETQNNPSLSVGFFSENPEKALLLQSSSSSSISKEGTDVQAPAPEEKANPTSSEKLPAESPIASASHTEGARPDRPPIQFMAFDQSRYASEDGLRTLAAELKLRDVNVEYYLNQIGLKAGREDNRTPEAWHTYATRFLLNDAKRGHLVTDTVVAPTTHANAPRTQPFNASQKPTGAGAQFARALAERGAR